MKNIDIFRDYMELNYKKGKKPVRLHDSKISDLVISRTSGRGCTIHYLYSGASLLIPWEWIDLFGGLYVHSGDRILRGGCENNYYDVIILLLTKLQIWIGQTLSTIDGDKFLDTVADISMLGTTKFRKYLIDNYNTEFTPFKFVSLEKVIDI